MTKPIPGIGGNIKSNLSQSVLIYVATVEVFAETVVKHAS